MVLVSRFFPAVSFELCILYFCDEGKGRRLKEAEEFA